MGTGRRIGIVTLALALLGLLISATQSWGQDDARIGTVLAVDGIAEARAVNATAWEPLQFRAAIFQNDTVRTGADSKVKILLRDDAIMTLAERSEMEFTEFLLNPEQNQRRSIVSLALGKLRVVTTRIFGAGSETQVRTANTVAGVRGTSFVVIFTPPATTQVLCFDGVVTARNVNPAIPQVASVPANFSTQVQGDTAPAGARAISPAERQSVERELRLTEQVPAEVQTTSERQATAGPVRGEQVAAPTAPGVAPGAPAAPLGSQPAQETKVAVLPITPVTPTLVARPEQILTNIQTMQAVTATAPQNISPPIEPSISPAAMPVLQQSQLARLRFNITIPRPR